MQICLSNVYRVSAESTRGGRLLSIEHSAGTGRKSVFSGKIIDVAVERAELPGGRVAELEVVHHPGGAAVVALDAEGRVCLLRQYRHPIGGWLWELPAGKLDVEGESPRETALRELEEEAGVSAAECVELGRLISTPGFCDEVIHLYFATGLTKVDTAHGDNEIIEIHWLDFGEALRMARDGEIEDGKSVAALFRAEPLVNGTGQGS